MVNPIICPEEFIGLSTDTKPTKNVPNGSTFHETDGAKNIYIFNAGSWNLM